MGLNGLNWQTRSRVDGFRREKITHSAEKFPMWSGISYLSVIPISHDLCRQLSQQSRRLGARGHQPQFGTVRPSMVQHEPQPRRLRAGRAHGCHSRTCRPCSSHSEQQRAFSHPRQRQSPKAARRMWRQLLLPGRELERRNARTPRFVSSGPPLQASTASRARCSHLRLHSRWTGHDHGSNVQQ